MGHFQGALFSPSFINDVARYSSVFQRARYFRGTAFLNLMLDEVILLKESKHVIT